MTHDVDVVIAVHDLSRPIRRAVASVLAGTNGHVGAIVVCHGIDPDDVGTRLRGLPAAHVRLLATSRGAGQPAVPMNLGLDAAAAPYVALLGSDDWLEPGALRTWSGRAVADDADAVLAPLVTDAGVAVRTPRARPGRARRLDLVRDRLAYRTAPLGVLRRARLDELGLRLTEGVPVGEDAALSTRLWATSRIGMDRRAPRYVITSDAKVRTTFTPRPLSDELSAYDHLRTQEWFAALPEPERRAVAVKTVRVHVLGAVLRREAWSAQELATLRAATTGWTATARDVLRPFSRADRDLLDVVLDPAADAPAVLAAAALRRAAGRSAWILTRGLAGNADRESTVRYLAADRAWPRARPVPERAPE